MQDCNSAPSLNTSSLNQPWIFILTSSSEKKGEESDSTPQFVSSWSALCVFVGDSCSVGSPTLQYYAPIAPLHVDYNKVLLLGVSKNLRML
jgi:hypothetical protein